MIFFSVNEKNRFNFSTLQFIAVDLCRAYMFAAVVHGLFQRGTRDSMVISWYKMEKSY